MNIMAFDEINEMVDGILRTVAIGQQRVTKEQLQDTIEDLLEMAYALGTASANDDLGTSLEVDADEMLACIDSRVVGKTFRERIDELPDDLSSVTEHIRLIAETEAHRVLNDAGMNTARKGGARYKTWITQEDDRVRDSHDYLLFSRVGIDDEFYTYNGDHALAPGGFGVPEEDCNCRCYLIFSK